MRKLTFILNPASGGRRQSDGEPPLARQLAALAPDAEVLVTARPGQARAWASERSGEKDRAVIAVGGDGTVHEVGGGLIGGRAVLGVLPVGSGNDFAKVLETPHDLASAVQMFAGAEARACDAGEVIVETAGGRQARHHFVNGLGMGYEAVVADAAARARVLRGFARYLVAALWKLATYRAPSMTVVLNSQSIEGRMFMLAVGNGRCAGGRFYLTPEASISDGLFDVCYTQSTSVLRVLRILPTTLQGRHERFPDVHTTRTKSLEIACPEGCMVHADGELLARRATRLSIRLLPGALRVLGNARMVPDQDRQR